MSTSKSSEKRYHHGDLRGALIASGLKALKTCGEAELSLRGLARDVGVSPTAVYRHFPDKRALLGALANEGIARLGAAQQKAFAEAGGGASGFAATGRAYVRFALEEPALFRLAFTHGRFAGNPLDSDDLASRLLRENALALTGGDVARATTVALQAWASAHGLAMLILDGRLPSDNALIDAVLDSRTLFGAQGKSSEASP